MTLSIDGKRLDDSSRPYIIAELSGNHGQSYAQAERLVAAAAEARADAVKVQTFTAEEICADVPILFGHNAAHDAWCRQQGATRLRDLMSKGGFPRVWHKQLKAFAESLELTFLSTPFSVDAARFLVEDVGVGGLKIASGDLTFTPLLEYVASTGLPILLSTGGATVDEVETALAVFDAELRCRNVVLMHCVSVYPCHETFANLAVIARMHGYFPWIAGVGWSDHTLSTDLVPALAIGQGASCIEKHLRLEDDTASIDAAHSLTPSQFTRMVEVIRRVPAILGDGVKQPHALEMHDRLFARRDPSDWLRPQRRGRLGEWE